MKKERKSIRGTGRSQEKRRKVRKAGEGVRSSGSHRIFMKDLAFPLSKTQSQRIWTEE